MAPGYYLPMADVLMACPNLVSLTMTQPSNGDLSTLPMTTWSKMTALSISQSTNAITTNQVVEIWKRLPSLKTLLLHPCSDIQSAFVVSDYCPSMRKIEMEMTGKHTKLIYLDQGHEADGEGITDLSLHGYPSTIFGYEDISKLIKRYCQTLNFLEWGLHLRMKNDDIFRIQRHQLKKLVVHSPGWWIQESVPRLQELEIASNVINATLETIPPELQKLTLRLDTAPQNTTTPVIHYLNRAAQHPTLTRLAVYFSSEDPVQEILDAICRLNQLEHLAIIYTADWDADVMEGFFDQLLKGCPRLTRLELKAEDPPTTHSMNALKQLQHLKELTFSVDWPDSDPRFWDTVQALTQVKRLRIYPAISVDMPRIRKLRQQRPDMEIIIDHVFKHF